MKHSENIPLYCQNANSKLLGDALLAMRQAVVRIQRVRSLTDNLQN
ncbi:hypothetical protein [Tolypothrix sp. VBCCA 56010]